MKRILLATCLIAVYNNAIAATVSETKVGETKIKVDMNLTADMLAFNTYGAGDQKTGLTFFSHVAAGSTITADNDIVKYGLTIALATNTVNSRSIGTSVFMESGIFKFVAGSDQFAGSKLKFDGGTFQKGSPCMAAYQLPINDKNIKKWADGVSLVTMRDRPGCERARNVGIFLSSDVNKEGKVNVGISYAPADSNMGSANYGSPEKRVNPFINNLYTSMKDVFSLGANYKHEISGATVGISVSYEQAKPEFYIKALDENSKDIFLTPSSSILSSLKVEDFSTLGFGVMVGSEYIDVSAGMYSMGKSLSINDVTAKQTGFDKTAAYSLGLTIKFNDFALGASYTSGTNIVGTTSASWNISGEYNGLQGASPYFSFEKYSFDATKTYSFKDTTKDQYIKKDDLKGTDAEIAKLKADKSDAMFKDFVKNVTVTDVKDSDKNTSGSTLAVGIKISL